MRILTIHDFPCDQRLVMISGVKWGLCKGDMKEVQGKRNIDPKLRSVEIQGGHLENALSTSVSVMMMICLYCKQRLPFEFI